MFDEYSMPADGSPDDMPPGFRRFISPDYVDHMVREAIRWCWMSAPNDKRSVGYVETEIRRIADRALRSFAEDASAFGAGEEPP